MVIYGVMGFNGDLTDINGDLCNLMDINGDLL